MRQLLLAASIALIAAFAPQGAEAKTLRMAYDSDPTSLDPHEQLSGATLQMSHLLFDPLIRFRQDLSIEPRLAKSFEQIDERTTRFHLREGVRFQSGRTLSAEDVVWTFNRLKQSPDFKALFDPFSEARAVDGSHRRSRDEGRLSARAQSRHLHLSHGSRVLFRPG